MSFELAETVQRAQDGDKKAFAQLYSLVYKDMYRLALLNLGHEADASDVVSDTVLEGYTKIRQLREPTAFKAWLTAILTANINKKLREYVRDRNFREDIDDYGDTAADEKTDIQNTVGGLTLQNAMQRLTEEERQVLSLSTVSGYTSEEIAEITGIAANTVRSKISRAKDKLRKMME